MRKVIRIENPTSGAGFTSGNRARRFVKSGVAVFTSPGSIRFTSSLRALAVAVQAEETPEHAKRRDAAFGYDRVTRTFHEAKNTRALPLLMPFKALRTKPDDGKSGWKFSVNRNVSRAKPVTEFLSAS